MNQTKALGQLFGKGKGGAEALLKHIKSGNSTLPKGVTRQSLERYRVVAERAIKDGKTPDVQKLRIKAIDELLKPKPE